MNFLKLSFILVFVTWLTACGDAQTENATEVGISTPAEVKTAQENAPAMADTEFADAMTDKVFQNYLHLRSALVDSDGQETQKVAGEMSSTLGAERPQLNALARQIAETDDLAVQRRVFAELTPVIEPFFADGMKAGTFYKMHCPMAMEGEGADWFSEIDQVRNPFYGEKMLTCGRVTEEYTK